MWDKTFYKSHNRQSLLHILVVFVTVIVGRNVISIVLINSRCSNDRSTKITSNIFSNYFRVTKIGFGINVEPMFMLTVAFGFYFFERWINPVF